MTTQTSAKSKDATEPDHIDGQTVAEARNGTGKHPRDGAGPWQQGQKQSAVTVCFVF